MSVGLSVHVCTSPAERLHMLDAHQSSRRSQGVVGDWRAKCQVGSYLGSEIRHAGSTYAKLSQMRSQKCPGARMSRTSSSCSLEVAFTAGGEEVRGGESW